MKFVRKFPDAETRDEVLAIVDYEVLSYTEGAGVKIKIEGSGPEPVGPTDRLILKFMVTENDWNEDAGKYQKQLIADNCGALAYDGSCFDYMIKDNERIDEDFWSRFIYFDTLGEHTVELIFNEEFDGNLPENCLRGCYMHEAIISSNVISISDYAFDGCRDLTSVIVSESVASIGNSVFSCCDSLTSVGIPNSVTSIGNYVFADCIMLISVTITEDVASIGDYAFNNCHGLTSITCNAINPPYLGGDAFNATNDCPIYVPASSVDAYKAASGWSTYASRIQAIQS